MEYWPIDAILQFKAPDSPGAESKLLTARFIGIDGEPARVPNLKWKDGKDQFIANAVPN